MRGIAPAIPMRDRRHIRPKASVLEPRGQQARTLAPLIQALHVNAAGVTDRMVSDTTGELVPAANVERRRLKAMGPQQNQPAAFLPCVTLDCIEQLAAKPPMP